MPPQGRDPNWVSFQYGGANPDWTSWDASYALPAANRPLWPYIKAVQTFRCTADQGVSGTEVPDMKEAFLRIGTSYKYNDLPWWRNLRNREADHVKGIAEKPVQWVPEPNRFILLHEWPALPDQMIRLTWTVWHLSRSTSSFHSPNEVPGQVISPILLVDGHCGVYNFAEAVKSGWPAEPRPNWIWYKAR